MAALLLIPGLPVIGLLVVLVRLTSRGPGLYRQQRVGHNGKVFWLYKLRTMIHQAELRTGPVWSQPDDPRITRVGRILRKLHLDEFPQLINVLRGDMTLIGPRPERPEFVHLLHREIPGYLNRLGVRPGISGLAQVNLPPDTDVDSVRRKLALDLEYIATATPLLDLQLVCCTAIHLLGIPGDLAARLLRLLRSPDIRPTRPIGPRPGHGNPAARRTIALSEDNAGGQISFGAMTSSES